MHDRAGDHGGSGPCGPRDGPAAAIARRSGGPLVEVVTLVGLVDEPGIALAAIPAARGSERSKPGRRSRGSRPPSRSARPGPGERRTSPAGQDAAPSPRRSPASGTPCSPAPCSTDPAGAPSSARRKPPTRIAWPIETFGAALEDWGRRLVIASRLAGLTSRRSSRPSRTSPIPSPDGCRSDSCSWP